MHIFVGLDFRSPKPVNMEFGTTLHRHDDECSHPETVGTSDTEIDSADLLVHSDGPFGTEHNTVEITFRDPPAALMFSLMIQSAVQSWSEQDGHPNFDSLLAECRARVNEQMRQIEQRKRTINRGVMIMGGADQMPPMIRQAFGQMFGAMGLPSDLLNEAASAEAFEAAFSENLAEDHSDCTDERCMVNEPAEPDKDEDLPEHQS
jgi:hypothetical protein